MKKILKPLISIMAIGAFSLSINIDKNVLANDDITNTCKYDSVSKVNPDFPTMNCLLTETALSYDMPPEVVKAIAEGESRDWRHFDQNGEAIVTADNGIGIMQITNQASYDQDRLKNDIVYNIEAGVQILNRMFERTDLPRINSGERDVLEHWYFAIMAYNGTKPVNSPIVQASGERNAKAYQERIFGIIDEFGLIDLTKLPFSRENFKYDPNSNKNIEFAVMNYDFDLPLTKSKHFFETNQKVSATTNVTIRTKPTKESNSKGTLREGEIVTITGPFKYDANSTKKNHFVWYPVKRDDGTEGYVASSYLNYLTPPITTSNVTVTNNFNKADVITFKNLIVGAEYTIYKDEKKQTKITSFTATSSTAPLDVDQLGTTSGSIYITVKQLNYSESATTEVKYAAEIIEATPAIAASNVKVTNNFNKADVITFENLVQGQRYSIYKDATKKTKITSFTADSTSKTINVQQLGASASAIYITVTKSNYGESATTKVNYKAEKLPALVAQNVTITNNIASDTLAFKGLTKGYTYTVYTDAALKKKLTSFTATATKKNLTVKQVGAKRGFVYVVVSKSGYLSSSSTKVAFKAQPTATLSSKNVKVTNAKVKDTIQLTGLKKGTTYVIYQDAKKKTKLATFTATGTTKTVTVKQLGTKAGKIYITAQESGYSVSALTTVSYSKQK